MFSLVISSAYPTTLATTPRKNPFKINGAKTTLETLTTTLYPFPGEEGTN